MKKRVFVIALCLLLVAAVCFAAISNKTFTFSLGAATTAAQTEAFTNLGPPILLYQAIVYTPNTDNNITFTFAVTDASGNVIRSYAGLAENTTHVLFPNRVVKNGYYISVTPSGAAGNACSVKVEASLAN